MEFQGKCLFQNSTSELHLWEVYVSNSTTIEFWNGKGSGTILGTSKLWMTRKSARHLGAMLLQNTVELGWHPLYWSLVETKFKNLHLIISIRKKTHQIQSPIMFHTFWQSKVLHIYFNILKIPILKTSMFLNPIKRMYCQTLKIKNIYN